MPRKCTVCTHKQAAEINKLLVANRSYRVIASQFGLTQAAVGRHSINCVGKILDEAREAQRIENAVVTEDAATEWAAEIEKILRLVRRQLQDPDVPGEYTLDGHAAELQILYDDPRDLDANGKPKRKRIALQQIINETAEKAGVKIVKPLVPHPDYMETLFKAADRMAKFLELLGKLRGEFVKAQKNPMDADRKEDLIQKAMAARNYTRDEAIAWLKTKYANVREFADLR